jgi:hypothetical protein
MPKRASHHERPRAPRRAPGLVEWLHPGLGKCGRAEVAELERTEHREPVADHDAALELRCLGLISIVATGPARWHAAPTLAGEIALTWLEYAEETCGRLTAEIAA